MKITKEYLKQLIKEEIENIKEVDAIPPQPDVSMDNNPAIQALRVVKNRFGGSKEQIKQELIDQGLRPEVAEIIANNYNMFKDNIKKATSNQVPPATKKLKEMIEEEIFNIYEQEGSDQSSSKKQVNSIIEKIKEMLKKHESGEEKLDSGMVRGLKAALENIKK